MEASCVPIDELCDNKDNDCDGRVDETVTSVCGSGIGECRTGTQACQAGTFMGPCMGEVAPAPSDACDSEKKDENCNGIANEDCSCSDGDTQPCGNSKPPCKQGTVTCTGGAWSTTCVGETTGKPETCDGVDNNCDGTIDNGATCNPGLSCVSGQCVECTDASQCPRTMCMKTSCSLGKCQLTPTQGALCGNGDVCDGSGQCVDCNTPSDCEGKVKNDVCNIASCTGNVCKSQVQLNTVCGSGARCTAQGECAATCGNAVLEPSLDEECDPGIADWATLCSAACKQQIYGKPCTASSECVVPGAPYTGQGVCGANNICVPTCMATATTDAPPDVCPQIPNRSVFCAYPFCFLRCSFDSECPAGNICGGGACGKTTPN